VSRDMFDEPLPNKVLIVLLLESFRKKTGISKIEITRKDLENVTYFSLTGLRHEKKGISFKLQECTPSEDT